MTQSQSYAPRYDNKAKYVSPPAETSFEKAKTIYLYQVVEDICVGMDRNENGDLVEMLVPYPQNLYFSQEFGGTKERHSMEDWQSLKKEVILRGYFYNGRTISRAGKDGRDFGAKMSEHWTWIENAILAYAYPTAPQIVKSAPTWSWVSLSINVILIVALALILSRMTN